MYMMELGSHQSVVILDDGARVFFSYGVEIATKYPNGEVKLTDYWNVSRTTTKWLCVFLGINSKELRSKIESGEFTVV